MYFNPIWIWLCIKQSRCLISEQQWFIDLVAVNDVHSNINPSCKTLRTWYKFYQINREPVTEPFVYYNCTNYNESFCFK